MKLLIIGDIHGEWYVANKLIKRACERHADITAIVQLGDLGDHWPKQRPRSYTRWNPDTDLPVHWLDGNHDNHNELSINGKTPNPKLIYQPRGSVLEIDGYRMMFFGGATSSDKDYRHKFMAIPGNPTIWWPEESITRKQYNYALAQDGPIHAMFSHDRPDCFETSFSEPKDELWRIGLSDRRALEGVWTKFRPQFCFWGHYHERESGYHDGTEWVQLPNVAPAQPMDYVIWDGKKVERSW